MMTPILAMTGATGFVGRATLRRAVAAGWHIRALTRRPQQPVDGVTWIAGALDRPDSLAELTADSEAMLHIAGGVNVQTRPDFEAGNATEPAHVVDPAPGACLTRFVHASPPAAHLPTRRRPPGVGVWKTR